MGGGGLLIFYVANVANVANVSKCILLDFPTKIVGFSNSLFHAKAVPLHRISKRAEIVINANYSNKRKLRNQYKKL